MMRRVFRITVVLALFALLNGCFASLTHKEIRANIDGTITTDPMLKMPPLYERGVEELGVVFVPDEKIGASHVGATAFTNNKYLLDIDTSVFDSYVADEFVNRIENGSPVSAENLSEYSEEISDMIKKNGWTGDYYLEVTIDGVDEKIRQSGYNTVLYIEEMELPDHIGGTNQEVYSKGIYSRFGKLYAHAGFLVALLDLESGQEMKHGAYRQGSSAVVMGISWKDSPDEYSENERDRVVRAVKERIDVNIDESLNMLRVVPKKRSELPHVEHD